MVCSIKRLYYQLISKRSEFCEDCDKKALLALNSSVQNETLLPELSLVIALPDVVHRGKSLRSSWFIDLKGARSKLVLIRTLRDPGSLDIRKNFGEALPSLVCETKIIWQLNQSYTSPDQQS